MTCNFQRLQGSHVHFPQKGPGIKDLVLNRTLYERKRTLYERVIIHDMDQEIGKMSVCLLYIYRVIQISWDILVQLSQPETAWILWSRVPSRLRIS